MTTDTFQKWQDEAKKGFRAKNMAGLAINTSDRDYGRVYTDPRCLLEVVHQMGTALDQERIHNMQLHSTMNSVVHELRELKQLMMSRVLPPDPNIVVEGVVVPWETMKSTLESAETLGKVFEQWFELDAPASYNSQVRLLHVHNV